MSADTHTPHSFIPGLQPSFAANPYHRSLPFLLQDRLHGFPRVTMCVSVCLSQLPLCLCVHVQCTSWLNSGAAVKRLDHVVFPEVLE